ncbi:E4 [Gammapapillomavirus 24]|uniref:E4 protein n=2 Tax=Papillomaviridae TaxID=151340 RepID=A0A385PJZ8_9PAPI|nr:E4 [Gammapapillomavirus 24]AYA94389.1 MAG: E4 protein [Human papillomavirus]
MDFTMRRLVVTEFTLHCLIQMLTSMDTADFGLCILKLKLLLPPPALQSLPPLTPGRLPPTFPQPPKTPYPPRKVQEDSKSRRSGLAPGRRLQFDEDDENKENQPPKENLPPLQKEEEEEEEELTDLECLLRKWGRDIDQFQEAIYHDLSNFRKRLGIRQS